MIDTTASKALSSTTPTLYLDIAGIRLVVRSLTANLKLCLDPATALFATLPATSPRPDLTVEIAVISLPSTDFHQHLTLFADTPLFDSGASWRLYQREAQYHFCFTSQAFTAAAGGAECIYKIAIFNADFTQGTIYLDQTYLTNMQADPLEYPLPELLFNHLLSGGRGVEVHACGVQDHQDQGYLFVGQSEAGKTTMSRLWQPQPHTAILSDDRIIVRQLHQEIRIFGTPWHGEANFAAPQSAPLRAIFFLRHGPNNQLIRQTPVAAIAQLFACSFPPFYNPQALDATLAFYQEITTQIPCFDLFFSLDGTVVDFIHQQLTLFGSALPSAIV
jgi:hypothetical protein